MTSFNNLAEIEPTWTYTLDHGVANTRNKSRHPDVSMAPGCINVKCFLLGRSASVRLGWGINKTQVG